MLVVLHTPAVELSILLHNFIGVGVPQLKVSGRNHIHMAHDPEIPVFILAGNCEYQAWPYSLVCLLIRCLNILEIGVTLLSEPFLQGMSLLIFSLAPRKGRDCRDG